MDNNMNHNNVSRDLVLMQQLKAKQRGLRFLGIGLMIIGALAVIFSSVSTLFSMVYLGCLLFVIGVFKAIKAFQMNTWGRYFLLNLFLGVILIIAGIFIIMNPMLNAVSLTLFMAILFIITGSMRLFVAMTKRMPHKSWVIFSGVLNILLGILIWSQWPSSGLWVIGMFVGIDAFFAGLTCLSLSSLGKRIEHNHHLHQ